MERVAPNGQFKDVGVDQLFFSTTDAQGRIQETNNTFVELSRYTEEELRNAAHNIIRHPFMPGGVFKIMWDKLQRGETFAGYVRNLAHSGETYDVFATVTPIPGTHDYLSVRQRPCHDDHRALAMTIYAEVGDYEAQLRKDGMSAREAAEAGAGLIGDKLRESGFDNFDAYAHAMLPWEVFCRENMSTGLPQREVAGDLGTELAQAHDVHDHLDEWMLRLDELLTTAQQLGEAREELVDSLGQTSSLDDTIDARSASETLQIVQFQLNVWKGMQKIVDSYVVELAELITTLANDTLRERFQISVSRLHTAMLATLPHRAYRRHLRHREHRTQSSPAQSHHARFLGGHRPWGLPPRPTRSKHHKLHTHRHIAHGKPPRPAHRGDPRGPKHQQRRAQRRDCNRTRTL
ncbi:hypothetical protein AL08_09855 [Corynebacterium diphtheriae bv. gravis str. ISS 4746]|nr:hypothetical protein AL08_09855 [Corynebacterium diphtheriae bv. gravis str. ISS 4746]KLN43612.1 hypothetical protein AL09_09880 [Corynebacterium diphtheriae bv. gravis str. ISS 4749]CAB0735725.1 hypothetical protein FRC0089_01956 [Corynebacterium diphtheriae]